jgi:hypothetical protein
VGTVRRAARAATAAAAVGENAALPGYAGTVMRALIVVIAGMLFLAPVEALAGPPQTLAIVLRRDDAALERQAQYQAAKPVAVHVAGDVRAFDTVTITAHGPDGSVITAPLARTDDGFSGFLRFATPGTWTVALTTQIGNVSAGFADVPLDVVPAAHTEVAAMLTMLLAAVSTSCGVLLVLRRPLVPAKVRS